jgi:phage host-nuclease inhibitor protein Gam
MKTTTTSKPRRRAAIANDLEFEQELDTVAALVTDKAQLEAERAAAQDALNARFDAQIKSVEAEIKAGSGRCATYADKHRERLFAGGKERTSATALAVYGWRTVPPTLKTRSKVTWEKVTAKIKERCWRSFLRVREEPDKEVLERQSAETLRELGLKYEGGERFFIINKGEA